MPYDISLDRIYTPPAKTDGARILVDRLWPRGKRKDALHLTEWLPATSPSSSLRREWHSGAIDDKIFKTRYHKELMSNIEALVPLMRYARAGRLTLLTASKDPQHSHLPTLKSVILNVLKKEDEEADGRDPSSPTCYQ